MLSRFFRRLIPAFLLWFIILPAGASSVPAQQWFDPQQFEIRFHPDGGLTAGDPASIEIRGPAARSGDLVGKTVKLDVLTPPGTFLGQTTFQPGVDGRPLATFLWAWQTQNLPPGKYILQASLPDLPLIWQFPAQVLAPRPDVNQAAWQTVETACCRIHTIAGTDAARDIEKLTGMVNAQAADAAQRLNMKLDLLRDKVDINIIPRLLGQGGFANDQVYVSYRDRSYVNTNAAMLIHHELVHRLDMEVPSKMRPTFFVEGLAVYLSDGHYQPEPLMLKVAAVETLGWYIPLTPLMDDFYNRQHEIGYLEAGALIEYMVGRWGRDGFERFYRNIEDQKKAQSVSIDQALQQQYGIGLAQLERDFREALPRQVPPDLIEQTRLTIEQFDTMRAYQQALDPSAWFRTVWLPDAKAMRSKGIVADYLTGPTSDLNAGLEQALYETARQIEAGQFNDALVGLEQVQARLRFARTPTPEEQVAYWQAEKRNGNRSQ